VTSCRLTIDGALMVEVQTASSNAAKRATVEEAQRLMIKRRRQRAWRLLTA